MSPVIYKGQPRYSSNSLFEHIYTPVPGVADLQQGCRVTSSATARKYLFFFPALYTAVDSALTTEEHKPNVAFIQKRKQHTHS